MRLCNQLPPDDLTPMLILAWAGHRCAGRRIVTVTLLGGCLRVELLDHIERIFFFSP